MLILVLVFWMATIVSSQDISNIDLTSTEQSFVLRVNSPVPISLAGMRFRYTENNGLVSSVGIADFFPFINESVFAAEPNDCFIIRQSGINVTTPRSCTNHIYTYDVNAIDIFWYDSSVGRDVTITISNAETDIITCQTYGRRCSVAYITPVPTSTPTLFPTLTPSITPTPSVTPTPTPVVPTATPQPSPLRLTKEILPDGAGVQVSGCQNNLRIFNGVEFILTDIRPGFEYIITAVNGNEFDPRMAVLNENGLGYCNDDDVNATNYDFNLLEIQGRADPISAQIRFSRDMLDSDTVSIVVGSAANEKGAFILVVESEGQQFIPMRDGLGDIFSVRLTRNMAPHGVRIFMLSADVSFDPYIYFYTLDNLVPGQPDKPFVRADNGRQFSCDDAGSLDTICDKSLVDSSITTAAGEKVSASEWDAYMSIAYNLRDDFVFDGQKEYLFRFMLSSAQAVAGQYTLVIVSGTGVEQES